MSIGHIEKIMELFKRHDIKHTLRNDISKYLMFKGMNGINYELCFLPDGKFMKFNMMYDTMSGCVEGDNLYYEFLDDMFYITISNDGNITSSFILGTLETNRKASRKEYMLFGDDSYKGTQLPNLISED